LFEVFIVTIDEIKHLYPGVIQFENNNKNEHGIKGGFINNNLSIFIIVDKDYFFENIYENTDNTLFLLKKIINHELVHREQYIKIGDKITEILKRDEKRIKAQGNITEPREIMAYAKTAVDELERFFSYDQILDFLRKGIKLCPSMHYYENVDQKLYKIYKIHLFVFKQE